MSDQPKQLLIEGRGGGKDGGGSTPSEDTDSLRSTQIADITDLICEGQCGGPVNGLKSFFLDGVPIQNADGSYNFTGVTWAWRAGTPGQAALPGQAGTENTIPVGVQVLAATPVVRTINSDSVDTVRVTIGIPQLSEQDLESGDLHGSRVAWAIDVQTKGGGFVERYRRVVDGKNMSLYTKSVSVKLFGGAPYDIRVRRITPDSTKSVIVNAFSWISYSEIQSIKLRYPNSAISRIQVDAQQFSRIPVRSWDWLGSYMQVPSNYDPITRVYTGTWDGTFKLAWTNNPAWAMYYIVTALREGLGEYVDPVYNNKWALYQIGKYCDGLVPDGKGGMEPRFTCNLVLSARAEAYQVLRDFAAIFRGMVYWGNSTVEYSQDAPADAELLYTPANVVDGVFTYQDTSEKSQHSVFIAYWNDLSQQGKSVPEVYAPDDLITRYGVREMSMQLIGCTSRGQAARMCRWARYTEEHEGTLVSFNVGSDGHIAAPGKLFKIADPSEQGERLGGRIKAATTTSVTLDAQVELRAGETYTITVIRARPDDAAEVAAAGVPRDKQLRTITEERAVITASGVTTAELSVSPSFSVVPEAQTIWVLQSNGIEATTWRCLAVKEVAGKNQAQISAIAHNPSKFDAIELGLQLDEPVVSRLTAVVAPPGNLQLLETVYTDGTTNRSRLTASWVPAAPYLRHNVMWRRDTSWWQRLPTTSAQTVDIGPLDPGVYEVKVTSTNALGNTSPAAQASIQIAGGPSGVRAVRLKASALTFKVSAAGVASPAVINVEAAIGGLSGPVTWSVTSGAATLVPAADGMSATVAYATMSSEAVTISVVVVDKGQTFTDLVTIIKLHDGLPGDPGSPGDTGLPGDPGAPARSAQLSLDTVALPADGSGAVTSYVGAFSSLVIWSGDEIDATGWTYSLVNSSGVNSTLTGNTVTVTAMSALVDSGYVDITATRSGLSITKRLAVIKAKAGVKGDVGEPGNRGTVQIAHEISGTSWSDSAANAALTDAGFSGPMDRDVVTLYNTTEKWSEARFYSSGSWLPIGAYIDGNLIVDGTVSASKVNVDQLSALSANIGYITAGKLGASVVVAGELSAATGYFVGKVSAGSVDVAKLAGTSDVFDSVGWHSFITTSDYPTIRFSSYAGGGGGGGGNGGTTGARRGGGGGQGGFGVVTYTNVPAGTVFNIYVGDGGDPGIKGIPYVPGNAGQDSVVEGLGYTLTAHGGNGGTTATTSSAGTPGTGGAGFGSGSAGASGFGSTGGGIGKPGAGGNGAANALTVGIKGSNGLCIVEAYNENGVVLRSDWATLIGHLNSRFGSYTWP
jgi:predicted phage tail protein